MRGTLSRRLQGKKFYMSRSISMHGIRSNHVPGKPAGHRIMPPLAKPETLSYGHTRKGFSSTIADANEQRDWRIYADLAQSLITKARRSIQQRTFRHRTRTNGLRTRCNNDRSVSVMFPWANFRQTKSAIKLHTLLDFRGSIPTFIHISEGKLHEVNSLDFIPLEPGAFLCHGSRLSGFCQIAQPRSASSSSLSGPNQSEVPQDLLPSGRPVNRPDLRSVRHAYWFLSAQELSRHAPPHKIFDPESNKTFVFLTNNFSLPALTIAQLYHCRWQVELFFKWIKQNLRIKCFYGTSENAVKTQIWIAISIYVLVAILKKELNLPISLYTILQVLSVSVFERTSLIQLLTNYHYKYENTTFYNQLNLFDETSGH